VAITGAATADSIVSSCAAPLRDVLLLLRCVLQCGRALIVAAERGAAAAAAVVGIPHTRLLLLLLTRKCAYAAVRGFRCGRTLSASACSAHIAEMSSCQQLVGRVWW
jgi:hypothetical protein